MREGVADFSRCLIERFRVAVGSVEGREFFHHAGCHFEGGGNGLVQEVNGRGGCKFSVNKIEFADEGAKRPVDVPTEAGCFVQAAAVMFGGDGVAQLAVVVAHVVGPAVAGEDAPA